MTYNLAKTLKDAGFPQRHGDAVRITNGEEDPYSPTLEELIEACGGSVGLFETKEWNAIKFEKIEKSAYSPGLVIFPTEHGGNGFTPTEAVAKLWLALNKHEKN